MPKYEELLRWLVCDEPESHGLGLGAGVVHNMFFVDSYDSSDRVESVDKPFFRRFMQKIADRYPDDVGMKFRKLRGTNLKFMEDEAAFFRVPILVKKEGPLGFVIDPVNNDNSIRVVRVTGGIGSVEMLRKGDILVPKDGDYGGRYTTFGEFRDTITDRPCQFDAITK